jgi:hypothetical protein
LDYLLEAKQQELLNNRIKRYEDQILRRIDYLFDDNESNEDDDDIRTSKIYFYSVFQSKNIIVYVLDVRRKAVGLGDNPF